MVGSESDFQNKPGIFDGMLVKDRYLIQKELGRGGFAVTYLAADTHLDSRPVVIKVLLDHRAEDAWVLRKFRQEMQALARLDHPGIVAALDSGELPDGKPFLVMQFIRGFTLRQEILPRGMNLERTAMIVRQLGQALSAAHDSGICHRDIKPENIMLQILGDSEEQTKLLDFGIASVRDSLTTTSGASATISGSWGYMAPEQIEGRSSPASDIYALGAVAYEMVTGRPPFNADTPMQLIALQARGVSIKPQDLRPSLPEAAGASILKALAKEPEARYTRARDFGEALAKALTSGSMGGASAPMPAPPADPSMQQNMEIGHVLFMDLVGYSTMPMDTQTKHVRALQRIVGQTPEYVKAESQRQLTSLPTGDGLALVFFGDPVAAVKCALSVASALKAQPDLKLRMGVHSGPVFRVADINAKTNVAGDGINMAQRVMDCGDAGHILLSRNVAETVGKVSTWAPYLSDLGEHAVKHGARIHLFNLYTGELGNPAIPERMMAAAQQVTAPTTNTSPPLTVGPGKSNTLLIAILVGLGALVVIGGGLFWWSGSAITVTETPPSSTPIPVPAAAASSKSADPPPVSVAASQKPPAKTDTPSGLSYVQIPAGTASVGLSPGDLATTDLPPRPFETQGFWEGTTEVTTGAYLRFARATNRRLPDPAVIQGRTLNPNWAAAELPMVMVDWQDASDFCSWDGGRLPNEFEYEYAARGGTTEPTYGPPNEIAWFVDNSGPQAIDGNALWTVDARKVWVRYERMVIEKGVTMHPVAQKKPNAFGLYDTLGNVLEWTADDYQTGRPEKAIRGSAWGFIGPPKVSQRDRYPPTTRNGYLGFRCVIDLKH